MGFALLSDHFDVTHLETPSSLLSFLDHGGVKYLHVKLDYRSYGSGA